MNRKRMSVVAVTALCSLAMISGCQDKNDIEKQRMEKQKQQASNAAAASAAAASETAKANAQLTALHSTKDQQISGLIKKLENVQEQHRAAIANNQVAIEKARAEGRAAGKSEGNADEYKAGMNEAMKIAETQRTKEITALESQHAAEKTELLTKARDDQQLAVQQAKERTELLARLEGWGQNNKGILGTTLAMGVFILAVSLLSANCVFNLRKAALESRLEEKHLLEMDRAADRHSQSERSWGERENRQAQRYDSLEQKSNHQQNTILRALLLMNSQSHDQNPAPLINLLASLPNGQDGSGL